MSLGRRVAALERAVGPAHAPCRCQSPAIYLEGQREPRPIGTCPRCGRHRPLIVVCMEGGGPVPGADRLPSRPPVAAE